MKKIILCSVVALIFSACNNNSSTGNSKSETADTVKMSMLMIDTTKLAKGTIFYQCPMDLEVISDKPGSCSKCGMDLEKVEKK